MSFFNRNKKVENAEVNLATPATHIVQLFEEHCLGDSILRGHSNGTLSFGEGSNKMINLKVKFAGQQHPFFPGMPTEKFYIATTNWQGFEIPKEFRAGREAWLKYYVKE